MCGLTDGGVRSVRSKAVSAVLYLYTTGSLFEQRMNGYMSNGVPFPPLGGLGGAVNSSGTEALNSAYGVSILNLSALAGIEPVAPGEFRDLDVS